MATCNPLLDFVRVASLALALVLAGCGGGGDGDDTDGSQQNQPGPRPPAPSANAGVMSYTNLTVSIAPGPQTEYRFALDLAVSDTVTEDAAAVTDLLTREHVFNAPGTNTRFGRQVYSVDGLQCTQPGGAVLPYSVVGLFDRSGSMAGNDPQNQTLVAARAFVERMSPADRGIIAAFPQSRANNRPGDPVTFYNPAFTSDQGELLSAIASVGAPSGGTPLWDSAVQSLQQFGAVGGQRALLVFSDGEDTASTRSSPADVMAAARNAGVPVYSINLRNSNSQQLDAIALGTGGSVFSTDDVQQLIAFYRTLGQLLSGQSVDCRVSVVARFEPDPGVGEVAYGPASGVKPAFRFAGGTTGTHVVVDGEIDLPFYPGRRLGQTASGVAVFETDVRADDANVTSNCLRLEGGRVRNRCAEPVYATVCNANEPSRCRRGVLQPGDGHTAYTNNRWAGCPWREPYRVFEPVERTGSVPNLVYTEYPDSGGGFLCVNAARGPF